MAWNDLNRDSALERADRMYEIANLLMSGADAMYEVVKLRKERDEWRSRCMKQSQRGIEDAHAMTGAILSMALNVPKIAAKMAADQHEVES